MSRIVSRAALERFAPQALWRDRILLQFLRGAGAALVIGVASRIISFPTNIVLARTLGTEDFGRYVFVVNWLGVLLIVGTLGFSVSFLRFVPTYIEEQSWGLLRGLLGQATRIVLLLTLGISAALALVTLVFIVRSDERLAYTFLVGCLVLPLAAMNKLREASLRALNRIALSESLEYIAPPSLLALSLLAAFTATGRQIGSHVAMLMSGGVELACLIASSLLLRRALPLQITLSSIAYRTREWVRVSVPLSLVSGMLLLMSSIDVIVVGIMLGPASAGVYAVAANLARFTMFGIVAANTAAQPMIAALYGKGDAEGLQRLVRALVWTSASLAAATALALVALHKPLLGLFGEDFLTGTTSMLVLIVGRLINSATGPSGSLLAMTKHQDLNAFILGVSIIVNAIGAVVATSFIGMEGAAVSTSVSLTLMTVWTWIEVRRRIGVNSSIFTKWRRGAS